MAYSGWAMVAGRTIACVLGLFGLALSPLPTGAAEIAISCGAIGQEMELCRSAAERWAAETGNGVEIVSTPNDANQRLALYQQILAARSPDIDVFQIDVVWPGILGYAFEDLGPHVPDEVKAAHFPAAIANDTVDGRLVAMPWFIDIGLLYYRRDLLERYGEPVPKTWADLHETASAVVSAEREAGRDMWGWVFQARAYEGLTCNALEWVASFGGGTIVDDDGAVTIGNGDAAAALDEARSWIGGIAPEGVLNYAEEEARGVFQSGRAVFMRNWPYAWALANGEGSPVAGKVGVTALPRGPGGRSAGAMGGAQLAVSKFSRHKAEAIDLVLYLTSAREQKRRAIAASFNPTIRALYDDPEVLAANPFFAILGNAFETAVSRPSGITGVKYNRVSNAFWNSVHEILAGDAEPARALDDLSRRLERMRGASW